MTYSEAKQIINLANDLQLDKRELFDFIEDNDTNFEIDDYKFISHDEAIEELCDMYKYDTYILGCFNSWFISDCTDIDYNVVEALQKAEAYEELGQLILDYTNNDLTDIMEEYIRLDGYGHALNSYDGNYEEVTINGIEYIYFRV